MDLQFIAHLIDQPGLITPPASPQPTPSVVNENDQPTGNHPVETPTETLPFTVDPELENYDDSALLEMFPDISATPTANTDSTADDSEEDDAADFLNMFDDSSPNNSVTEYTEPIPTPTAPNEPSTQILGAATGPTPTPKAAQPHPDETAETAQATEARLAMTATPAAKSGSTPAPKQAFGGRGQSPAESPVAAANNTTAALLASGELLPATKTLDAITCQHNAAAIQRIDICTIVFAGLAYGSGTWIADINADGLVDNHDLDTLASEYRRPFLAADSPP